MDLGPAEAIAQRAAHCRHPLRHQVVQAEYQVGGRFSGHAFRIDDTAAGFALVGSYGGYTTNIPLGDLLGGKSWIVYAYEGAPLSAVHGGPARLLVPHLYFWKSAKWVRSIELRDSDAPGFWERLGYHSYGDPWQEQRYAGD